MLSFNSVVQTYCTSALANRCEHQYPYDPQQEHPYAIVKENVISVQQLTPHHQNVYNIGNLSFPACIDKEVKNKLELLAILISSNIIKINTLKPVLISDSERYSS